MTCLRVPTQESGWAGCPPPRAGLRLRSEMYLFSTLFVSEHLLTGNKNLGFGVFLGPVPESVAGWSRADAGAQVTAHKVRWGRSLGFILLSTRQAEGGWSGWRVAGGRPGERGWGQEGCRGPRQHLGEGSQLCLGLSGAEPRHPPPSTREHPPLNLAEFQGCLTVVTWPASVAKQLELLAPRPWPRAAAPAHWVLFPLPALPGERTGPAGCHRGSRARL